MHAKNLEVLELDIYKIKEHINVLHGSSKGYITIASKNGNYKQWHYKENEITGNEEDIIEVINSYISQNTFYKPQRRIENIKELRALYIDIDIYNTNYTKEGVIYFLENDMYGKIPRPNFIIDSGRGLYYVLLIEAVPSMALPLWYSIQRYLYENLKEFGADAKALDPTRILRIPGSINSKSNSRVEVLEYYDYRYTLREIQENYLPDLKEKREKKKGRPKKVVSLYNEYSLYHARILDIAKICEMRHFDLKGHRELILFLYRYYSCSFTHDESEALNKVLELNQMFKEPLSKREVERDTKSAERYYIEKKYRYTNARLIELLEITEAEQINLVSIISTREKYRRNNERRTPRNKNGNTNKQQELLDKKNEVLILRNKGYSLRDIAKSLDISLGKVQRLLKSRCIEKCS
ncbi:DNA-binding response regulator [Clostridium sp.]|uniref:DNA-binding response regulator n=1 Tax=Clostridium sp. TaxID=1506 RepID=UPI00306E0710